MVGFRIHPAGYVPTEDDVVTSVPPQRTQVPDDSDIVTAPLASQAPVPAAFDPMTFDPATFDPATAGPMTADLMTSGIP